MKGTCMDADKAKPALGSGKRFEALKGKLAQRPGITSPGGLAAKIGRQKLGKRRFQELAAAGRERKRSPKRR